MNLSINMEQVPLYKMHETVNGWAVVDTQSKQPVTPIYFVSHCGNGWSIANAIMCLLVTCGSVDVRLNEYEKYKYKPFKHV
jgi:hypothetical protein